MAIPITSTRPGPSSTHTIQIISDWPCALAMTPHTSVCRAVTSLCRTHALQSRRAPSVRRMRSRIHISYTDNGVLSARRGYLPPIRTFIASHDISEKESGLRSDDSCFFCASLWPITRLVSHEKAQKTQKRSGRQQSRTVTQGVAICPARYRPTARLYLSASSSNSTGTRCIPEGLSKVNGPGKLISRSPDVTLSQSTAGSSIL
jgi:hypothetical protein